jgi:hypothetical protein
MGLRGRGPFAFRDQRPGVGRWDGIRMVSSTFRGSSRLGHDANLKKYVTVSP